MKIENCKKLKTENCKLKIARKYLLYFLAVVIIFGVFGAHRAEASIFEDVTGTFIKKIVAWGGYLILGLISKVLALAGFLFDLSMDYSINKFAFTSKTLVTEGWTITRDIANLFFIFILLYIAIATILQLSGYGMKELLVTVIILALLVNFSLVITRFIIDGSNILASEFYNKITQIELTQGTTKKIVGPSEALMAVFNPTSLFNVIDPSVECVKKNKNGTCAQQDKVPPAVFQQGDVTLVNIFIITIMGSAFFLVLAFVFFAGAVLFVIRAAVLWILMILSPLAFLFMALPATKSYASQWWKKLFDQAFFAPAFLFLLYLTIKIVSSKSLLADLPVENSTLSATFMNPASNVNLVLKYVIMIVLTIASLIIAKQMGAVGASTVQGWGQSAKKWGQGQAGKIALGTARRVAGRPAESIAAGEGNFAKTIRGIPLFGKMIARGAASVGVANREKIGELQKKYEKYTDKELKNMMPSTPFGFGRTAVLQELVKRKNLKIEGNLTENEIKKSRELMEKYGMFTGDLDKLRPDLVPTDIHPDPTKVNPDGSRKTKRQVAIESIKPSDVEKVGDKLFTDDSLRTIAMNSFGSSHVQKILDRGGEAEKKFFSHLAGLGDDIEPIARKLEEMGNRSLAGWVRGGLGSKQILESYGMKGSPSSSAGSRFESIEPGTKTFKT